MLFWLLTVDVAGWWWWWLSRLTADFAVDNDDVAGGVCVSSSAAVSL